jgi:hypothetical protein
MSSLYLGKARAVLYTDTLIASLSSFEVEEEDASGEDF